MTAIVEAKDLARHYDVSRGPFRGSATVRALAGASFTVEAGTTRD
jgi:dipeptide transport system ATP-binding protein